MYITINDTKYEDAKRTQTAQRVTYIATELTEDIILIPMMKPEF